MDTSAFGADTDDVSVSEVLKCMDGDFGLPIAGAVAIVVHIFRLAVLVLALFACVLIYCFAASWLAHLWLQSWLLKFTATLLRSCMSDITVRKVDTILPSEAWLNDPAAEPLLAGPLATSIGSEQPVEQHDSVTVPAAVDTTDETHHGEHHVAEDAFAKGSETTPRPADDKRVRMPAAIDLDDELVKHEDSQVPAAVKVASKAQNTQQHDISQPVSEAIDSKLANQEKKIAQTSFIDSLKGGTLNGSSHIAPDYNTEPPKVRSNPFNITPEQLAEASSFMSEASRTYETQVAPRRRNIRTPVKSAQRPRATLPSAAIQKPKTNTSTPTAATHSSGVLPPHIRKSLEAKAHREVSEPSQQNVKDQKVDAVVEHPKALLDHSPHDSLPIAVAENAIKNAPEDTSKPSQKTSHGIIEDPPVDTATVSVLETNEDTSPALADGWTPTGMVKMPLAMQPEPEPEHDPVFSRKQPSHPERLDFYDSTPELVRPSKRSMTAGALKAFNTTSSHAVEDRIDEAASIISGKAAYDSETAPRRGTLPTTAFFERPIHERSANIPIPVISVSRLSDDDLFQADDDMDDKQEPSSVALDDKAEVGAENTGAVRDMPLASDFEATLIASHATQQGHSKSATSSQAETQVTSDTIKVDRDEVMKRAVKVIQDQADAKLASITATPESDWSTDCQIGDSHLSRWSTPDGPSDLIDLDDGGGLSGLVFPQSVEEMPSEVEVEAPAFRAARLPSFTQNENEESHFPHGSTAVDFTESAPPLQPDGSHSGDTLPPLPPINGRTTPTKPPGLGEAHFKNLAAFDALLPSFTPPQYTNGHFVVNGNTARPAEQKVDSQAISRIPSTSNVTKSAAAEDDETQSLEAKELDEAAEISKKRQLQEQKKMAREKLKETWVEREQARLKVMATWSLDNMQIFGEISRLYNEKRADLAALMSSGQLNEEDAKVFPVFSTTALTAPKVRPQGIKEVKLRKKAVEEIDASSNDKDSQPVSEIDGLKENMVAARKLREDALAFSKSPRPATNMAYQTFQDTARGKLNRASIYYKKKRAALAAAFPDEVLPAELESEFPEIL